MPVNSRAKGAKGEREFCRFLTNNFGVKARRGQQFSGGTDSPDVVSDFENLHFEVKRVQRFAIEEWISQAVNDAGQAKTPVVAHRRDRREWLLTIRASDLLPFAREVIRGIDEAQKAGALDDTGQTDAINSSVGD